MRQVVLTFSEGNRYEGRVKWKYLKVQCSSKETITRSSDTFFKPELSSEESYAFLEWPCINIPAMFSHWLGTVSGK